MLVVDLFNHVYYKEEVPCEVESLCGKLLVVSRENDSQVGWPLQHLDA